MKSSSANQLAFDYLEASPTSGSGSDVAEAATRQDGPPSAHSAPFKAPDFSAYSQLYAETSRIAGRINAANVSEKEINELLSERQMLLDKQFAKTITRKEIIRLEYVRWSLDRIEDAKYGMVMDMLDNAVERYERFVSDIQNLERELQALRRKKK